MGVDLKLTYRLFEKLMRVAPDLANIDQHVVSVLDGGLPLYCELLETGNDFRRVAFGQYWELQSGERIPDGVFEICIFLDWQLAEAISYEAAYRFDDAYPVMGEPPVLSVHRCINRLLEMQLDMLAKQGHILRVEGKPTIDNHAGQTE
ncbi:MAG: hypothetical protein WBO95_08590 [Candidatus Dechloromonas phosphoritropha]|jgi:uncharacterized protein YqiB (DUF1249 family)